MMENTYLYLYSDPSQIIQMTLGMSRSLFVRWEKSESQRDQVTYSRSSDGFLKLNAETNFIHYLKFSVSFCTATCQC